MSCNVVTDPGGCIAQGALDGMHAMAQSFVDGASWAVKTMTTAWLAVPSPDVSSSGSTALWLQDRLSYFVLVAMFVSILWAAYRMATTGQFEHAGELARSLARLFVVSGCVGIVTTAGLEVGDAVTKWILGQSHVVFSGAVLTAAVANPAILILLALVVIVAQIVQLFIMLVKNAMVIALVGFIPLTAAATNTPTGKQGYQKALTWLGAFILYKPVAAIIYAISFRLSLGTNTISGQMEGIALMLLAIFALPALMKFLVPVTVSVTGGNAGALAGAAVGAALATGAVIATGGAAAGAGGFAGSTGPSGAAMTGSTGATGASGALNAATTGASVGGSAGPSRAVGSNDDND